VQGARISRGATLIAVSGILIRHLCQARGQGISRPQALGSDNGANSVGNYSIIFRFEAHGAIQLRSWYRVYTLPRFSLIRTETY